MIAEMNSIQKNTLNDCLTDSGIINEALFVLHQGNNLEIQSCASFGAHILLPNMMMNHQLIMQTIIRESRKKVVMSELLWEKMKNIFTNDYLDHADLVIYKHLN
jgi:hypothetical protein